MNKVWFLVVSLITQGVIGMMTDSLDHCPSESSFQMNQCTTLYFQGSLGWDTTRICDNATRHRNVTCSGIYIFTLSIFTFALFKSRKEAHQKDNYVTLQVFISLIAGGWLVYFGSNVYQQQYLHYKSSCNTFIQIII